MLHTGLITGVVLYLSFVGFVLLAASLGDQAWVQGKVLLSFTPGGGRRMALCDYADNSPSAESDMDVDLSDAPARTLQQ